MEKPQFLRVVQFGQGPMVNNGRSSVGLVLEDKDGNKYYTWFLTKNNYVEGIMKTFGRLVPVQMDAKMAPDSGAIGTDGKPPDENETMVKHSSGMKE